MLRQAAQCFDQRQAIHFRHVLIGQYQIDGIGFGLIQPFLPIRRFDDVVADDLRVKATICRMEAESSTVNTVLAIFHPFTKSTNARCTKTVRHPLC